MMATIMRSYWHFWWKLSCFSLSTQSKILAEPFFLPVKLTGVGHHQASSGVAEHTRGPQLLFTGADGSIEREQALLASVHGAAVIPAQVSREGLGGSFCVELRPLSHTQRDHEGALNFDLDVWQGVKELLVRVVLEAEGSAVRPSHCKVRLHRGVEEQRVACRDGERTKRKVT